FQKIYDYEFLYPILIVIGLVLLLVVVRQYILNKSNKNLQKIVEEKTKNLKLLNETLEEKIRIAVLENTNKDAMLYQQAKMASMGEMIGNIAHQWRQPLSVISTTVTGLNFKMEYGIDVQPEEMIDNLERVNDTVQFLSKTIDDFQNYLKPQDVEEKFNIKEVIVKNLEMFGKAFENNDIKIILNFDDIFLVNSKNELLQVAINVLNNAKDALKEFVSENRLLFVSIYKEDNNAIISIKDNAGGIPEEVLPKIFDAYFTTKHKSQGTGLGLYMSYQIITNRFNGSIDVTNDEFEYMGEIYKGANFKLILPIDTIIK
ncbi:MAG: GHKL domain-containing protein, partial [Arcobacter sp.]|nr:GHKL domain-containing protein [Arcobacter sp.]